MAVPKAGYKAPKEPRRKSALGIILLCVIFAIAIAVAVFLIKNNRPLAQPKPTITQGYIGLASHVATNPTKQQTQAIKTPTAPVHTDPSPSASLTPRASQTPTRSKTPSPSPSPSASPTAENYPFIIRNSSQLAHTMYFPNEKCETSIYVVGQVLDYSEKDVIGYVVKLTGVHAGKELNKSSETGSMQVFGDSGFGFVLPNQIEKDDEISIQLFDPQGQPLSKKIVIEISGECDANLLLIRYKQSVVP